MNKKCLNVLQTARVIEMRESKRTERIHVGDNGQKGANEAMRK